MVDLLLLLILSSPPGHAGERAGITMPDTLSLGETSLVLNGMGLRERLFFDQVVVGLYLTSRTSKASAALDPQSAKSLRLHVVGKDLPATELSALLLGHPHAEHDEALVPHLQRFEGWLLDLRQGDRLTLDYQPGIGTELSLNGSSRGTIDSPEFMQLVWRNLIGPHTPRGLREDLLGG